jgi:hypothetical protein
MIGDGVTATAPPSEAEVVASGLVLPRLAAFGPPLNLATLDSPQYGTASAPAIAFTWARFGQMIVATVVGLVVLVIPMSALAYAADQLTSAASAPQRQHIPGGDEPVGPVVPGDDMLTPADSTPGH